MGGKRRIVKKSRDCGAIFLYIREVVEVTQTLSVAGEGVAFSFSLPLSLHASSRSHPVKY